MNVGSAMAGFQISTIAWMHQNVALIAPVRWKVNIWVVASLLSQRSRTCPGPVNRIVTIWKKDPRIANGRMDSNMCYLLFVVGIST